MLPVRFAEASFRKSPRKTDSVPRIVELANNGENRALRFVNAVDGNSLANRQKFASVRQTAEVSSRVRVRYVVVRYP